jgi:glyceraldehyde-3-phosphate dehydrogenase/erythrose-4-phosphate dehydrogenase
MTQVRIAVAGAGMIGRKHISVLRAPHPDFTLAAVADPSPAAAEAERAAFDPCGVEAAHPQSATCSARMVCAARARALRSDSALGCLDAAQGPGRSTAAPAVAPLD